MVIVLGIHLFPFRTEKLSPIAPMVLRNSGRVGSRHLLKRHLSSQKLTWVPLLFLLHRCAASILYEYLLLHAFIPPSFIYSPLVHPFPPFLNRIFSIRTCVTALPEHSCSAHIYSMGALFSWHTIFSTYYSLDVLSSVQIYCLHVSMLCPHCRYLLFPLSCSGCLAFYFVCPFLPSYQVFF